MLSNESKLDSYILNRGVDIEELTVQGCEVLTSIRKY